LKTHNFDEAPFSQYFRNVYSQNGEDGVIEEILNRIGWSNLSLWAAEFGAWDGRHLSNTFSLVESRNFNAVYIEGDSEKFKDLVSTSKSIPRISPLEAMISSNPADANSLDNLLAQTAIPNDFDILSVDIDSYDLDIWESLNNYHPKVVVIEINSGIMPGVLSRHNKIHEGNSFSSTLQVANKKEYFLVCHTGNCIFFRRDLLPLLGMPNRYIDYPELLFRYEPMWMPVKTPIVRLLVRRILPLSLKILIMTAVSKIRFALSKDLIPKND
jgi:hypothetical protein